MSLKVRTNEGKELTLDILPDHCPFCHVSILPKVVFGYHYNVDIDVLMACPKSSCKKSFIAYYTYKHNSNGLAQYAKKTSLGYEEERSFSENIEKLSESFVKIFNEAFIAEQHQLFEICGVGYRKALEFLIKDYAISKHEDDRDKIEKMGLSQCINIYVSDVRVKQVAIRAVWLGNDETHYVRKWEGKNLNDLKRLIDLTLHWIEFEILTDSYENEMPSG